jgi:hypothetical protein
LLRFHCRTRHQADDFTLCVKHGIYVHPRTDKSGGALHVVNDYRRILGDMVILRAQRGRNKNLRVAVHHFHRARNGGCGRRGTGVGYRRPGTQHIVKENGQLRPRKIAGGVKVIVAAARNDTRLPCVVHVADIFRRD